MTISEKRENYRIYAEMDANSSHRRVREYASYVNKFLDSPNPVDGMTYEERLDKLPMPYNKYFG